jgi:hypothetical protein
MSEPQGEALCPGCPAADMDTHIQRHEALVARVDAMHNDLKEIRKLLDVWNQAKGFVIIMRALGHFARAVLYVVGFAGALVYFLKSGHWIPPE